MSKWQSILLKITKIGVLVTAPLALMFLGTFITMLLAIRGREVTVPNVVGIEQPEAEKILKRAKLQAVISGSRFSADFPPGQVIMQIPEASSRVKARKKVKLLLSEGKRQVVVPQVTGLSIKEATMVLTQSGLRMGLISRAHVLDAPNEKIVQQFPPPGATGLQTPYVNLLINLPAEGATYLMPDLHGWRAAETIAFLEKAGFILRTPRYESSFTQPAGIILSHYPEAGLPLARNIPINLVVSR